MKPQRTRISAYALITNNDHILLCRISDELPRWTGQWTLPGGGIDFGEDPEDAVIREVREETGLNVAVQSIVKVDSLTDFSDADDFHGIRLLYEVKVIGGELKNEINGTTDKAEWIDKHQLSDLPLVSLVAMGVDISFPALTSTSDYEH